MRQYIIVISLGSGKKYCSVNADVKASQNGKNWHFIGNVWIRHFYLYRYGNLDIMIMHLNPLKMSCDFHFDVFKYIIDVMFTYRRIKCMLINFLGYEFYHNYASISTFGFKPFKNSPWKYIFRKTNLGHSQFISIFEYNIH